MVKTPGGGKTSKRAARATPPQSPDFSLRDGEKTEPLSIAVTDFLADLRLDGSERVLGALALALAEGMDASPAYAKGRLARELRKVLAELAKAELVPANLELLRGVEL
jgi:hypothetical protein